MRLKGRWSGDGLNLIVWIEFNIMMCSGSKRELILLVGIFGETMTESSVKFWYHMHESIKVSLNSLCYCIMIY